MNSVNFTLPSSYFILQKLYDSHFFLDTYYVLNEARHPIGNGDVYLGLLPIMDNSTCRTIVPVTDQLCSFEWPNKTEVGVASQPRPPKTLVSFPDRIFGKK